jgi:hypothetical protein
MGLLTQVTVMFFIIVKAPTAFEKIVRASSFSVALLIYFGAKSFGLSLTDIIIQGITNYNLSFAMYAVLFPSSLGIFLGWYFARSLKRSSNIAIRVLILVGVFSVIQFTDIYLKAFGLIGLIVDKTLTPNLIFTISVSLYIILRVDPGNIRFFKKT